MSAPKTDLEKQKRQHAPALLGIRAILTYVAILLVAMVAWLVWNGNEPEGAAVQVDDFTGAPEADGAE